MPAYRDLTQADLELRLFHGFLRRQVVTKCRRRVNGAWTVVDAPFVDDWTERDHRALLAQLARTLRLGGFARATFERGAMKGFAAVGAEWFGDGREYLDLTNLHVSEDARRQGIGRALFLAAARWARDRGAQKLYISAHSAIESRRSTGPWAALRRTRTTLRTSPRNRSTVSSNTGCRRRPIGRKGLAFAARLCYTIPCRYASMTRVGNGPLFHFDGWRSPPAGAQEGGLCLKTAELVDSLVRETVEAMGFSLCDVEFQKEHGNWVLTLFIDREGGVSVDDCERVSHAVDPILDEADPIEQHYYLSVSSLGLDRPLKKDADYARSIGKELIVRLYAPQEGKKEWTGTLRSFDAESFELAAEGGVRRFLRREAALVRPDVRF